MGKLIEFFWVHIPQIAISLIMAAIGAYLLGLNNRRNRKATAAAIFRDVILAELQGLYPIPSDWPDGVSVSTLDSQLRNVFPELQKAVTTFRPSVTWYRRRGFDRAWDFYRRGDTSEWDEADKQSIDQCYYQYASIEEGQDYKGNFKRHVDKLLSYAKPR